jgi:hypothetical protein
MKATGNSNTRNHPCSSQHAWDGLLSPDKHHRSFRALTSSFRNILAPCLIVTCVLMLVGCDNRMDSITEPSLIVEHGKRIQVPLPATPYSSMSFAVWRVDCPYQSQYGPAGSGYRGTTSGADDAIAGAEATWDAINRAGFTSKWMSVRRDWLSAATVDWARVDSEISFAVRNGADFISVDDALSPCSWGGPVITDATMSTFCRHVHLRGKRAAAADNDGVRGLLASHPHFFDSVDVIMPYGYNRSFDQLQSYFMWVATKLPGKAIVPILGYHVLDPGHGSLSFPNQLGEQSGDAGFIELAQRFAAMNADPKTRIVMYYYEPECPWTSAFEAKGGLKTYLDSLTSYMLRFAYIAPSNG